MMNACARAIGMTAVLLGPALALGQSRPAAIAVQAGVTVRRDTVRVGDPFEVVVGVRAPLGATITFPEPPDSTLKVQGLDPVVVADGADSAATLQYATYRVAAWDVNALSIVLGEVVVQLGTATRRIPLETQRVFVQSVLPADSALRLPKPARSLLVSTFIPWWVWALIAAAVAVATAIWFWWRNRRKPAPGVRLTDPYEQATREFARVEALGLLDAGERGRYVALMVEVLRGYLADRFPAASLAQTTSELLEATHREASVAHEGLLRVLHDSDLVKFARRPVSLERARELGGEARALVKREHEATLPVAKAAA